MNKTAPQTGPIMSDEGSTIAPVTTLADRDYLTKIGVIGGVLLFACIAVVVLFGRPKPAEVYAFAFLTGAAAPLAAVLLFTTGNSAAAANRLLFSRLFLCFGMLGLLLLGAVEYGFRSVLPRSTPFLFVLLASVVAASAVYFSEFSGLARRYDASGKLDALLVALLAVITIVFSSFIPSTRLPEIISYAFGTPRFFWWLLSGLLFIACITWLARIEARAEVYRNKILQRLMFVGFCLFLLGLFDDELYLNLAHYLVHVGPAMHSLHGGIAMVDTYSIYGMMPWEAVKLGFVTIAPTFGVAALVVRISMLAYYLSMVVVLYRITHGRVSAMIAMAPMILVAVTFHPGLYNLGGLPSTSGLRYLVPALMVVILTAVRSTTVSRLLSIALLMLASLWSIEVLIYTLAPWGYVLVLRAIRTRSITEPGITLLAGAAAIAVAHLGFVFGTFLLTGRWVDYGPYFGLVANFRPDKPGFWAQYADPNFAVWVPIWLGLFIVLAGAGYRALRGFDASDLASRLVPVAALGFAELNYFAGFPRWSSLGLAFLPAAVVIVCTLDALAAKPRRYGAVGLAAMIGLTGVSATLFAFGMERFARPALYDQANRTVLRRCFTADGCQLAKVPTQLMTKLYASPLDPEGPVYQTLHDQHPVNMPQYYRDDSVVGYKRIQELVFILREFAPQQKRVAVLADTNSESYVGMAAFMETGQWYKWPFSSPLNDNISPGVSDLILKNVAQNKIENGELLILAIVPSRRDLQEASTGFIPGSQPDRDLLLTIEQNILAAIKARCQLSSIKSFEYHAVYRTERCTN